MTTDWRCLFTAETSREELSLIIERECDDALADVRAQIDAMTGATPAQRVQMLDFMRPIVRERMEKDLTSCWQRLQLEAASGRSQ